MMDELTRLNAAARGPDGGGTGSGSVKRPMRAALNRVARNSIGMMDNPKMQYELVLAETSVGPDGVVRRSIGIQESKINAMAKQGWRIVPGGISWHYRKLFAVLFERPAQKRAKKKAAKSPDPSTRTAAD